MLGLNGPIIFILILFWVCARSVHLDLEITQPRIRTGKNWLALLFPQATQSPKDEWWNKTPTVCSEIKDQVYPTQHFPYMSSELEHSWNTPGTGTILQLRWPKYLLQEKRSEKVLKTICVQQLNSWEMFTCWNHRWFQEQKALCGHWWIPATSEGRGWSSFHVPAD